MSNSTIALKIAKFAFAGAGALETLLYVSEVGRAQQIVWEVWDMQEIRLILILSCFLGYLVMELMSNVDRAN